MILLADGTPDALLRMLNQRYSAVQKVGPRTLRIPRQPLIYRISAWLLDLPHTVPYQQALYILPQQNGL